MKIIFGVIALLMAVPLINALDLTVDSPEEVVYGSTSVLFSLSAGSRSYFYFGNVDDSGKWIKLCQEKSYTCEKNVRAREGINSFEVKAVSSEEESEPEMVSFTVDSKKPRITKTFPLSSITNDFLFSVWYSEENLKDNEITLYYGEDSTTEECESGINKQCNFTGVDLSSYDGEEIEYWFEISDEVNTAYSKKTKIKVDVSPPEILNEQYIQDARKIKFIFDINEENFNKIIYKDTSDCLPNHEALGVLCSSLQTGRCVRTKTFCEGSHSMIITVLDKAGNSEETSYEFEIE